ncbi:MAG TPA: hypothetical protein VK968_06380, partial [Roseimicrobium sp.]|nr:hypothetical protein [Roseimicrobium sp.]
MPYHPYAASAVVWMLNFFTVLPAPTFTVAGTMSPGPLLARVTVMPPVGAGNSSLIVPSVVVERSTNPAEV